MKVKGMGKYQVGNSERRRRVRMKQHLMATTGDDAWNFWLQLTAAKRAINRGYDYFFSHKNRTPPPKPRLNAMARDPSGISEMVAWVHHLRQDGHLV